MKIKLIANKIEIIGQRTSIWLRLKLRNKLKNATQCDWENIDFEMKIVVIENNSELLDKEL